MKLSQIRGFDDGGIRFPDHVESIQLTPEEVLQVVHELTPKGAHSVKVSFKHGCRLAGKCRRLVDGGLCTEDFELIFYGDVLLTTVIHELAHVLDRCRNDHTSKEFRKCYWDMMQLAHQTFDLWQSSGPLQERGK
jgi:hypothetical protein